MTDRDFTRPFSGSDAELLFPGPVSQGARGMPVRRVQEWLVYHGQRPVIDGDFGAATERYVRVFQGTTGLPQSGTVDAPTWAALTAPLRRAVAPLTLPALLPLNDLVCAAARQHLAERPVEIGGPNDGPWVRAYMLGHGGKEWQWCAGAVSFWLAQAAAAKGVPMPLLPSFGVPQMARGAKARGRFLPDGPPVPGDVFVIPTAAGSWSHTGIVLAWDGGPKFTSAEGNTNEEGGSDGTCARSMPRTVSRCDFLRVGP